MLYSMYILNDRRSKFKKLLKTYKNDDKTKLFGIYYDISLAINEYTTSSNSDELQSYLIQLNTIMSDLKSVDNPQIVKDSLNEICETLNSLDLNLYDCDRYGQITVANSETMTYLFNTIIKQNRLLKIFEPRCGSGNNAKLIQNVEYYGLEENNNLAEVAKSNNMTKVIKGTLKGSRITNNVFDIIVCNCPIEYDLSKNMFQSMIMKQEKQYISNCLKYLREDGVIFITIPYYRMHKDICNLIAKNIYDVNIFKSTDNLIHIIGKKYSSRLNEADSKLYNKLRSCRNYTLIPNKIPDLKYELPKLERTLETFKGSILDEEEAILIAQTSGCIDTFFKKQEVVKLSEAKTQPLLPFNLGQIGLILTSGCLDGVVDEGDGDYHLVKGKVTKKKEIIRTHENGEVQEQVTNTNKVEINVLLPDGTYKSLA